MDDKKIIEITERAHKTVMSITRFVSEYSPMITVVQAVNKINNAEEVSIIQEYEQNMGGTIGMDLLTAKAFAKRILQIAEERGV